MESFMAMSHAKFVHLHVHSAYSLSEGAIKVPDLISLCEKEAMPAVAVTDTGNLFGALEFSLAARRAGIQLAEKKYYPDFTLGIDYIATDQPCEVFWVDEAVPDDDRRVVDLLTGRGDQRGAAEGVPPRIDLARPVGRAGLRGGDTGQFVGKNCAHESWPQRVRSGLHGGQTG